MQEQKQYNGIIISVILSVKKKNTDLLTIEGKGVGMEPSNVQQFCNPNENKNLDPCQLSSRVLYGQ